MQTALKYDIDVTQTGRVELQVPFSSGVHLTILVFADESVEKPKPTIEESVAALYTTEKITFKQAQDLLNHTNWQDTVTVLEQQGCQLYYDEEDLESLTVFEKSHGKG